MSKCTRILLAFFKFSLTGSSISFVVGLHDPGSRFIFFHNLFPADMQDHSDV